MAIHLHNGAVHTFLMDQTITKAPLRTGAAFSLALDRDLVHVYGEPAFHYFLDIERERSIRSSRTCVLLRVDLKDRQGSPTHMTQTTSEQLFTALAQSVRETDFIGWYEDQRVAAALLTEVAEERQNEGIRRTARPNPPPFRDALSRRRVEPPGYTREHDPGRKGLELNVMAFPSATPVRRANQHRPEFSPAPRRGDARTATQPRAQGSQRGRILDAVLFTTAITREQKRVDRSDKAFAVLTVELTDGRSAELMREAARAISTGHARQRHHRLVAAGPGHRCVVD